MNLNLNKKKMISLSLCTATFFTLYSTLRIMKNKKVPYSSKMIIDTLLHELAHSITDSYGHGEEWDDNNDYFQKLRPHYVEILKNKTFIKH